MKNNSRARFQSPPRKLQRAFANQFYGQPVEDRPEASVDSKIPDLITSVSQLANAQGEVEVIAVAIDENLKYSNNIRKSRKKFSGEACFGQKDIT